MKSLYRSGLILAVGSLALFFSASAFAQEKMSMEEYNAQLQQAKDREAQAQADLQACEESKNSINQEITSTDQQAKALWDEIYAMVGSDAAGVEAYRQQLQALEREVDGLSRLSPEELFKRRAELDDIESRLNSMKENKIYALTEMQNSVARIEGKITDLRNKMPKAMYDEYTVMRGDYLWKISGNEYGDPYQWIKIYSYNQEQIANPDLIYPDQVFKLQRGSGPNEYVVAKGDFLHKIAGKAEVYGDPTQWTKLYEANKAHIEGAGGDSNTIYPHAVLSIPR
ncbi:MAG: LysM peptidoglycan-binding domain-containing protein [Deferribacteres bacterium]|nr:LysM peptidoglycan-binding domain-containing protein [candidate division KSB1 bacterium]MCB9512111.1 LysM peptidoglycan-binding domain-containing protein [Deferribacteres bacterium]